MADTKLISGGVPHSAEYLVTADQVTIVGDGTTEDPLRVSAEGSGIAVQQDGSAIGPGPFSTVDFVGGGVLATDAGGGVAQVSVPGVTIEDAGSPLAGAPHATINFTGAGVAATDAGGGVAQVDVPGVTIEDSGSPVSGAPHTTINFTGAGVTATDAGGGVVNVDVPGSGSGSRAVMVWGFGTLGSVPAFLEGGGTNNDPSTTSPLNTPAPFAGTARNLYAYHNIAGGLSSSPLTYTLMVNGVASALAVSVPGDAQGPASNTTDTVAIGAGDLLSMRVTSLLNGTYLARVTCEITA